MASGGAAFAIVSRNAWPFAMASSDLSAVAARRRSRRRAITATSRLTRSANADLASKPGTRDSDICKPHYDAEPRDPSRIEVEPGTADLGRYIVERKSNFEPTRIGDDASIAAA